ncbi:sensor histidine kinase [Natronosalvus vescus]|uniref:sensor histidine kinase n=1 Tax=Natronosalvus vescus TaxID=2953881 RepID=UPI0020903521|nr:GAF domain-containing sensor histidine kinase [Natronosalvus vescus]
MGDDEAKDVPQSRLRVLHSVAIDLQDSETIDDICARTVEAAEVVLEFDLCLIALEEGGELPVRAQSSQLPPDGVAPAMSIDEGIAGRTYRTQQSYRFDDLSAVSEANAQGPYQSGLSVPIGDKGIFQAVSEESASFTDDDLQLVELLVSHTQSALTRVKHRDELERFARVVSHDLRNPLSVASGYLELAQDECECDHLAPIKAMHTRMETLIEELLILAQQGDIVSECEPVGFEEAIMTSWQEVATAQATLALDLEPGTRLITDPSRLRQLLNNLFRNAIDHASTTVTVRVGQLESGFYVEDDGPGIADNDQSHVLEWGYSTAEDGTGYGLHIVSKIARAHGWQIAIMTGTEGGARFEFTNVDINSTSNSSHG